MKTLLVMAGWICVALAVVGIFLPLLPTFDFLLLASICFAKSSPRFERWLVTHRRFGPALRAWREERSISRKHKVYSCGMIVLSVAAIVLVWRPPLYADVLVVAGASLLVRYILSRKTRLPLEACPLRPNIPREQSSKS